MKKILLFLVTMVLLVGCTGNGKSGANKTAVIADYFPFKESAIYEYAGSGKEGNEQLAAQQTYISVVNGSRIQRRVTAANIVSTEVMENANGELKFIYGDPYFYYYEDITDTKPEQERLILKEPLEVGNKWALNETSTCEITNMSVPVETSFGKFDCMEVTSEIPTISQKDYYAKGIGLVKTVYQQNGAEITIELKDIKEKSAFDIPVDFFAPADTDEFAKEEQIIKLDTNIIFAKQFTEAFKKPIAGVTLFSDKNSINSILIDRTKQLLYLDLSGDFAKDMTLDAEAETKVLQAIVNTIGNFYGVDQVQIVCDGKEYSSKNRTIGQGEYFDVLKTTPESGAPAPANI